MAPGFPHHFISARLFVAERNLISRRVITPSSSDNEVEEVEDLVVCADCVHGLLLLRVSL
jgi:hypothetical protein